MLELLYLYRGKLPLWLFDLLERFLWWRHWFQSRLRQSEEAKEWVTNPQGSERATLVEAVVKEYPFISALEVGCGFGHNFHHLATILRRPHFIGVDKNYGTILEGNAFLAALNLQSRVFLQTEDLLSGLPFKDEEFEVVYTIASLLYVRAEQIERALKELLRVCKRRLILVEQQVPKEALRGQELGVFVAKPGDVSGYWLRDYQGILEKVAPGLKITCTKIPAPRFQSEQWQQYGSVISVSKHEA